MKEQAVTGWSLLALTAFNITAVWVMSAGLVSPGNYGRYVAIVSLALPICVVAFLEGRDTGRLYGALAVIQLVIALFFVPSLQGRVSLGFFSVPRALLWSLTLVVAGAGAHRFWTGRNS